MKDIVKAPIFNFTLHVLVSLSDLCCICLLNFDELGYIFFDVFVFDTHFMSNAFFRLTSFRYIFCTMHLKLIYSLTSFFLS